MFSYRHYRKRYASRIRTTDSLPSKGLWVKVSEAADRLGLSPQTIRIRAFKRLAGKEGLPCIRVRRPGMKRGVLYVRIE